MAEKRGELGEDGWDVFRVADILMGAALAGHGDEIDLIGYYGSYALGVAGVASDLDIFYVPAAGKSPPVGGTYLIAGRLFDFWGLRWETLAGFATGELRGWAFAPGIVAQAKVLYARDAEQVARLAELKQSVVDLQSAEAQPAMVQRALDGFGVALGHFGQLQLAAAEGDLRDARFAGWQVILACWECLALANQVTFARGAGHLIEQVALLAERPADLAGLIGTIGSADDPTAIAAAAAELVRGTRAVLQKFQSALPAQKSAAEAFDGWYPEFKDGLRKVWSACGAGRAEAAQVAAWSAQHELAGALFGLENQTRPSKFDRFSDFNDGYARRGFADLLKVRGGDLGQLADSAHTLDAAVRDWLVGEGVGLGEFETVAEFEKWRQDLNA